MERRFTEEGPYFPCLSNGGLEIFTTILFKPANDGRAGFKVALCYTNAMNQEQICMMDLRKSIALRDAYQQRVNDLTKLLAENGVIERQRPNLMNINRKH